MLASRACFYLPQLAEPPGPAHRPAARAAGSHAGLATLRHAVTKRSRHSGRDAGTKSTRSAVRGGQDGLDANQLSRAEWGVLVVLAHTLSRHPP